MLMVPLFSFVYLHASSRDYRATEIIQYTELHLMDNPVKFISGYANFDISCGSIHYFPC